MIATSYLRHLRDLVRAAKRDPALSVELFLHMGDSMVRKRDQPRSAETRTIWTIS